MRALLAVIIAVGCLACPSPRAPESSGDKGGECASCDVRFIVDDKVDLVTLERITLALDNKVVFTSMRWAHEADVGPIHVAQGTHVARVLLVYRKGTEAYDVRSEHEFTARENLALRITPMQGGADIAPMTERIGVKWEELTTEPATLLPP